MGLTKEHTETNLSGINWVDASESALAMHLYRLTAPWLSNSPHRIMLEHWSLYQPQTAHRCTV